MRFIHISDLHFYPKNDGRTSRNLREELIAYLRDLDITADELLITGDYRHAGYQKKEQDDIDAVVKFIKDIANAVNITEVKHIHLVPGNHDRDRDKKEIHKMASIRKKYNPANGGFESEDLEFLLQKFEYFWMVCDTLYGSDNYWSGKELHTYRVVGETVFLYVNTAIMHFCDTDRRLHRLIIGNDCLDQLLNEIRLKYPNYPIIVLAHHSPDYFEKHEKEAVEDILEKHPKVFLYLCGDAHESWLRKINGHLEITMGCIKHEKDVKPTFLYGDTRLAEFSVHHWVDAWEPYAAANKKLEKEISSQPKTISIKKKIRPELTNSNRESHKLLLKALDVESSINVEKIIKIVQKALDSENREKTPDECTIAFSRYLLAHYLLSNPANYPEVLDIIEKILAFYEVKNDCEFYSDVLVVKAKALALSGKIAQARKILSLVDCTKTASFLETSGLVSYYEGDIAQSIETLNEGINDALKEYVSADTDAKKRTSYQHYFSFLTKLGSIFREIQRPDLSLELWQKAVEAAEQLGFHNEKARSSLLYVECLIQYEKFEKALHVLEDAYNIKKDDNDDDFFWWHYYNLKANLYLRRNSNDQNDVSNAIANLNTLLEREIEADQAINVLNTIAHIQAEYGLRQAAIETLTRVDQIIKDSGKNEYKELLDVRKKDISNIPSPLSGDNQYRPTIVLPSREQIDKEIDQFQRSENSLERLRLAFNIGMGVMDIDPSLSYTWLEKSAQQANNLWNIEIEARSLIGQASILFEKKTEDSEIRAETLIEKTLEIMDNMPFWDIRARAILLKGMSLAHKEDFISANKCFHEAKQLLALHNVKDPYLSDVILDCLDESELILARKKFTDLDFDTIIKECNEMNNWFPKYAKEMRQFLWYNRHEEIEKLIATNYGSKAFMITDNRDELNEWISGLSALFDIVSFTSETDYHTDENWNFAKELPLPKNMRSKYFNIHFVLTG